MAFELLHVALIGLIIFVITIALVFGILWFTLKDKFVFILKQRFFPKGGKIHVEFWHRDGTVTHDIQSVFKVNDVGIFWPGDKLKKYRVAYVPSNQRDSLGLPIATVVEGLNYTPDLRERSEQFQIYKTNDAGEIQTDEQGKRIVIEEWKQIVGAGFTTKKASELSYSNYVSAVAFGRATVLKEAENKQKEIKQTWILSIITVFLLVFVGALLFVHDGKFDTFLQLVSDYRTVADSLIAANQSSIAGS